MSLQDLMPVAEIEQVINTLTGQDDEDTTYLGETSYVRVTLSNLLPNTRYQIELERIAHGYWTEFAKVDPYYFITFDSGEDTTAEKFFAHLNWGPDDGADGTMTVRVYVHALINPELHCYSNTFDHEWSWDVRPMPEL